jgi:hypothetical protein
VEKVNVKKVDLNPIISIKKGMCPYFKQSYNGIDSDGTQRRVGAPA